MAYPRADVLLKVLTKFRGGASTFSFMQQRPVIPPNLGFRPLQESDSDKRKGNIKMLDDVGRQKWQEATSYGKRSGVENTNSRYKTIIGGKLRSKDTDNQNTEVQIGVRILNRMRALGIPKGRRVA